MALQLDLATLVLMFITLAITSFIVMFLIWRINRNMPGMLYWMVGTLLNTISALTTLLNGLYGWADDWGSFLGTGMSLLANLLVLQGALQFRGYDSQRRWQFFLALIPVLLIATWVYRTDPIALSLLHDTFTMMCQVLAGVVLLWRTANRGEWQANLLAASASLLIGLTIGWRLAATLGASEVARAGAEAPATQWYLFVGANLHVAWIFGLSVACYYRSRQQEMLLAREDSLTKMPNRRCIDEEFSQTLAMAQRSDEAFALIMLDINDFKRVNDRYGHSAGDKVLTELARRLKKAARDADFAGRLGGDEFIVLARQIASDDALAKMLGRLRQQLDGKMQVDGQDIDVEVSIGAAVFPADGDGLDTLLGAADASMYQDKKNRKDSLDRAPAI